MHASPATNAAGLSSSVDRRRSTVAACRRRRDPDRRRPHGRRPLGRRRTSPSLGPPPRRGVHRGRTATASTSREPRSTRPGGHAVAYVQYGKPRRHLDAHDRPLRLFLLLGVLGGTALALLAGLAVARRAMRADRRLTDRGARDRPHPRPRACASRSPGRRRGRRPRAHARARCSRALDAARARPRPARPPARVRRRRLARAAHAAHQHPRQPRAARPAGSTARTGEIAASRAALVAPDAPARGRPAAARPRRRRPRSAPRAGRRSAPWCARRRPRLGAVGRRPRPDASTCQTRRAARRRRRRDDLHRLALNLIENALLHTPPGTAVACVGAPRGRHGACSTVERRRPRRPSRAARRASSSASSAATATPSRAGGGSGLGLAIVRAVAEAPRRRGRGGEPGGRWARASWSGCPQPTCRVAEEAQLLMLTAVGSLQVALGAELGPDRLSSAWAAISGDWPAIGLAAELADDVHRHGGSSSAARSVDARRPADPSSRAR